MVHRQAANLIFTGILIGLFCLCCCNNHKANTSTGKDSAGRVGTVNTNELLMTIPTIENTFPDFENTTDTNNLKIIEDDWRQLEFVSKDKKQLIDQEIDSINYIFEHEMHEGKDYTAFKQLYVRNLIPNPVSLPYESVRTHLGDPKNKIAGIAVEGNEGQVKNGFSMISEGLFFYGLKDSNNAVSTLCFYGVETEKDLANAVNKISKFLAAEKLYLVDWPHRKVVNEKNIRDYFQIDSSK